MNRTTALLVGLLVILAICALTYRFVLHPPVDVTHQTPLPAVPLPSATGGGSQAGSATRPKTGVIYVVSATGGDDNDLAPKTVTWTAADAQDPARAAVNALIKTGSSPLPSGTALRGIKIVDGLATVDFTQGFQTNFHGGETEEAQTVNSILRTLGQFSDIDRVQILVEGKPIDALSQLPISGPLDVIRPDPVLQAKNAATHN